MRYVELGADLVNTMLVSTPSPERQHERVTPLSNAGSGSSHHFSAVVWCLHREQSIDSLRVMKAKWHKDTKQVYSQARLQGTISPPSSCEKKNSFHHIHSPYENPRRSWIPDTSLPSIWILDFNPLDSWFQTKVDSGFQTIVDSGFWIPDSLTWG